MSELVRVVLSLVPVFLFLVALFPLDSFKLVRAANLVRAIAAGAAIAVVCLLFARTLIGSGLVNATTYIRFIAPPLEETAKGLVVLYLIRTKRVGFMVDAAILGFAAGSGFAAAENLYYLSAVSDANLLLWVVRGFGTALLHGGATAILGIVSKLLAEMRGRENLFVFLPGLAFAVVSHVLFNSFYLSPVVFTLVLVSTFPVLIFAVFARSERLLRDWLEVGLGSDVDLLEMLRSGEVKDTRVGGYVRTLRDKFPGEVLADMLCYLQMSVELKIKAKGRLLMQEAGFAPNPDPMIGDLFRELSFLERSIGTTGKLALGPFLRWSTRDLWGLRMLKASASG
ncbi:MAG TPA: PrsW family glutamic-type intramembrane protease [Thermoanaerobaculaceae bacterium]|nr:PrsW family glutamic-type intramembrane protease [Thermoanaerobaculaceae bacterium]